MANPKTARYLYDESPINELCYVRATEMTNKLISYQANELPVKKESD